MVARQSMAWFTPKCYLPILQMKSVVRFPYFLDSACRALSYGTAAFEQSVISRRPPLPTEMSSSWSPEEFRQEFVTAGSRPDLPKWFPQHMYIGLKKMQAKLRNVDCVIEVHDARIPLCGRNPNFYRTLYAIKPHILILNKVGNPYRRIW